MSRKRAWAVRAATGEVRGREGAGVLAAAAAPLSWPAFHAPRFCCLVQTCSRSAGLRRQCCLQRTSRRNRQGPRPRPFSTPGTARTLAGEADRGCLIAGLVGCCVADRTPTCSCCCCSWCIASSPLILGLELSDAKLEPILDIIGNKEVSGHVAHGD